MTGISRAICALLCVVGVAALLGALFLTVVDGVCFDTSFYAAQYGALDTARSMGVEEETLMAATDDLLSYLRSERAALTSALATGESFFNAREKAHMVDVQALYQGAMLLKNVLWAVGAGLIALALLLWRKKCLRVLAKSALWSAVGVVAAFGVIGLSAALDFGTFWTNFHYVFFSNDLWMLDPATDRMIRMFPSQLFFDMVVKIVVVVGACIAAVIVAAAVFLRRVRRV